MPLIQKQQLFLLSLDSLLQFSLHLIFLGNSAKCYTHGKLWERRKSDSLERSEVQNLVKVIDMMNQMVSYPRVEKREMGLSNFYHKFSAVTL